MNYEMEELLPVAAELAGKYTRGESTSITYEKAEQLMEAVLYCIRELEDGGPFPRHTAVSGERLPARQAYEMGRRLVEERVRAALALYHEILPDFKDYGNLCLRDTFLRGIPEFFKWYDVLFAPQDTILTLDYPVLPDLSGSCGIRRIEAFLQCIRLEQLFLGGFPEGQVRGALREYHSEYEELIENVCGIVYAGASSCVAAGKPFFRLDLAGEERGTLRQVLSGSGREAEKKQVRDETERIVRDYYRDNRLLLWYLEEALNNLYG